MSDNPGMGVLAQMLAGDDETPRVLCKAQGKVVKTIVKAERERQCGEMGEGIDITFEDGYRIVIYDAGQSYCEERYMVIEENLDDYIGMKFLGALVKEGKTEKDEEYCEVHEVQFLELQFDKCFLHIANHNEHNGCYGGFWIVARELDAQGEVIDN